MKRKTNHFAIAIIIIVLTIISLTVFVKVSLAKKVPLPDDRNKLYLSVIGAKSDLHYQTVVQWFNEPGWLKELAKGMHYREITTDTVMYRERYKLNIKGLPTVRVQSPQGIILYEAYGSWDDNPENINGIPPSSSRLCWAIKQALGLDQTEHFRFRRHRHCPRPPNWNGLPKLPLDRQYRSPGPPPPPKVVPPKPEPPCPDDRCLP